jgi:hypothetical protein
MLSLMIFAWGTSYKLSLYKPDHGVAPAKVCTRGSDAAKSYVSAALNGRRTVGHGIVPSLPVYVSVAVPEVREVASEQAKQVTLRLLSVPIRAARPPPFRFDLS